MKRMLILIIFLMVLLVRNNVFAAPPNPVTPMEDNWEAFRVTKLGFSSSGLSQTLLINYANITDNDFDFVKTLDSPVWIYYDYDQILVKAHTESIGTISGIPVGSYYVYMYYSEEWYYWGGWNNYSNNTWSVMNFCLNGSCTSTSGVLTINSSDFIKVTIGNNQTTNLTQTLTRLIDTNPIYIYTFSAQSN